MIKAINSLLLNPLRDLFFPPVCRLCDGLLTSGSIIVCQNCLSSLTPLRNETHGFEPEEIRFDRWFILYEFDDTLRNLIHLFKYQHCMGLSGVFALQAFERFFRHTSDQYACVLAVPLHPTRERERGYNQSALLAEALAGYMGLPFYPSGIHRTRATPTQTKLSRIERRKNVANAFKADLRVPADQVLLVDDVITTGSTISACAETLKQCGVKKVDVFALSNPVIGNDQTSG